MECEKLASEKTEMQRHYVMVSVLFHISYNHQYMLSLYL
jgi:Groucho/TLE N-terminal Q-rich domain.